MTSADKHKLHAYLDTLTGVIRVEKVSRKRSIDSNNLYWLWLTILADDTGNDKNDLHEYCTSMFAPQRPLMDRYVPIRTSKMDTAQMSVYMRRVKFWALNELNSVLPEPDNALEIYHYYQMKGMI